MDHGIKENADVSLHDCRTNRIQYEKNNMKFFIPDGFYLIRGDRAENGRAENCQAEMTCRLVDKYKESFDVSVGTLLVLLATVCWGLENNCTRKISGKSTYEIVTLKGVFSGLGAFVIALLTGEPLPPAAYTPGAMLLGFVAYGLSIFTYVRAQRDLGAAKTSAFYAIAPFVGVLLSFLLVGEKPGPGFFAALAIMTAGTAFVVWDTMAKDE